MHFAHYNFSVQSICLVLPSFVKPLGWIGFGVATSYVLRLHIRLLLRHTRVDSALQRCGRQEATATVVSV